MNLSNPPGTAPSAHDVGTANDLLTEILRRVPATSLLRFKSVCKQWLSLISHPHFSLLLLLPKSISGLFLKITLKTEYKYIDFNGGLSSPFVDDPFVSAMRILDSCHGLLIFSSGNECIKNCGGCHYLYVYNPITKQFFTINPPPCDGTKRILSCVKLAFDPLNSLQWKLVFVHELTDPKFLHRDPQFPFRIGKPWQQISIYSKETGSWRLSGEPFTGPDDKGALSNGVFLNGTVHWPSYWSDISLRFDVDREEMHTMPMPPNQDPKWNRRIGYFGASRGHLHLIVFTEVSTEIEFDVLEMESDYSNWFVKYHVDLDRGIPDLGSLNADNGQFFVLHLVRGVNEEESYLVLHLHGRNFKIIFCVDHKDVAGIIGATIFLILCFERKSLVEKVHFIYMKKMETNHDIEASIKNCGSSL